MLKLLKLVSGRQELFSYALVDGELELYAADEGLDEVVSEALEDYMLRFWLAQHEAWSFERYAQRVEALSVEEVLRIRDGESSSTYQMGLF